MKPLFLRELKQNRTTAIIWTVSLLAVSGLYLSLFPALSKQTETISKVLMNYPVAVREALGITATSYSTLKAFYAVILGFITLAGAIQAANLGTALTSREERNQTAEFLLAKPIRRTTILTAKLLAAGTILLGTNIVYIGGTRLFIAATGVAIDTKIFLLMSLTLLLIQTFFLAFGFIISVSAKRIKSVLTVSLTSVFAFYIIGILDAVLGAKNIRYLTPFKFFDYAYIMKNSAYEWRYVILELVLVVGAMVAGYLVYNRRNIRSI